MNIKKVLSIANEKEFQEIALDIFKLQASKCSVYHTYLNHLNIEVNEINDIKDIPFLPIEFFKTHPIILEGKPTEIVFSSSGTTGSQVSKHLVSDLSIYEDSFRKSFELFYDDLKDTAILALLPSYLERTGSSLIFMIDDFIQTSQRPESGYFLYNHDELYKNLLSLKEKGIPTILFGVTYALLDFIEVHQ